MTLNALKYWLERERAREGERGRDIGTWCTSGVWLSVSDSGLQAWWWVVVDDSFIITGAAWVAARGVWAGLRLHYQLLHPLVRVHSWNITQCHNGLLSTIDYAVSIRIPYSPAYLSSAQRSSDLSQLMKTSTCWWYSSVHRLLSLKTEISWLWVSHTTKS